MIKINEVEDSMFKNFFSNAELENDVIEAVFNCMKFKDYAKVVKTYGLEQLKEICLVDYSTGIDDYNIFKVLKPTPQSIDFI